MESPEELDSGKTFRWDGFIETDSDYNFIPGETLHFDFTGEKDFKKVAIDFSPDDPNEYSGGKDSEVTDKHHILVDSLTLKDDANKLYKFCPEADMESGTASNIVNAEQGLILAPCNDEQINDD